MSSLGRICTLAALSMFVCAVSIAGVPWRVPVALKYDIPPEIKTGEEVTTSFAFVALQDIEELEVTFVPVRGVEIVSGPGSATFSNVRKGAAPAVDVRVRLTDPKTGALRVTCTARTAERTTSDSLAIVYGDRGQSRAR